MFSLTKQSQRTMLNIHIWCNSIIYVRHHCMPKLKITFVQAVGSMLGQGSNYLVACATATIVSWNGLHC